MTDILDDIAEHLDDGVVAGGSTAWRIFKGFMPPSPDRVIVILPTGSDEPDGDNSGATEYAFPRFQVTVRCDARGMQEARAKALQVWIALQNSTPRIDYVFVFALQSEFFLVQYDQNDRPELSCNFRVMRSQQTS